MTLKQLAKKLNTCHNKSGVRYDLALAIIAERYDLCLEDVQALADYFKTNYKIRVDI